ncbi:MAG: hypothetical protein RCG15_03365 [Candidatus Rickettsia vulgarisii]
MSNNLKTPPSSLNKIVLPQEISNPAIKNQNNAPKVVAKISSDVAERINKLNSKDIASLIAKLPLPPKPILSQQVITPAINKKDDVTKPKIEISDSVAENINKFEDTLSSTVKPLMPPESMNNLNLHHQMTVLDTNEHNDIKLTADNPGKVKQELEQFAKEVIDISVENNLITEQHKEKYLEINPVNKGSKFSNDIKEAVKEKTSFKNKLYSLAKRISKSSGMASMSFYLDKKISNQSKFKDQMTQIQTDLKNKQNNKKPVKHKKPPSTKKSSAKWYL